jgi:hypothetical protein
MRNTGLYKAEQIREVNEARIQARWKPGSPTYQRPNFADALAKTLPRLKIESSIDRIGERLRDAAQALDC